MIRATCHPCGHTHEFSNKHYGKQAKCRSCAARIRVVPDPMPQPAPAATAQPVTVNSTTVIASSGSENAVAAIVNVFFPPFGFLIQGRLLSFLAYTLLWLVTLLLCMVAIGFPIAILLWALGIVDALKYKAWRLDSGEPFAERSLSLEK